jgi:hypothetical protein
MGIKPLKCAVLLTLILFAQALAVRNVAVISCTGSTASSAMEAVRKLKAKDYELFAIVRLT